MENQREDAAILLPLTHITLIPQQSSLANFEGRHPFRVDSVLEAGMRNALGRASIKK